MNFEASLIARPFSKPKREKNTAARSEGKLAKRLTEVRNLEMI